MGELSETDQRILEYLAERVGSGKRYFRAKRIGDHLELSSKQVGARLPRLADAAEEVEIEQWGRARSTTWRVTPE